MSSFSGTLKGEVLKLKRSTVSVLIVLGALFLPLVLLTARLARASRLPEVYRDAQFWNQLWNISWESIAVLILPLMVILVTTLVVQIEYRNNAWKQVHTTPQSLVAIFFAKQLILIALMIGFCAVFNAGIYLVAVLPPLLIQGVPYPAASIPLARFAAQELGYFIDILPIVALQYLLALHFRNFMVALGLGIAQWIVVIGCLSWKYLYIFPYSCITLDYVLTSSKRNIIPPPVDLHVLAPVYFLCITLVGFLLYSTKEDRG